MTSGLTEGWGTWDSHEQHMGTSWAQTPASTKVRKTWLFLSTFEQVLCLYCHDFQSHHHMEEDGMGWDLIVSATIMQHLIEMS